MSNTRSEPESGSTEPALRTAGGDHEDDASDTESESYHPDSILDRVKRNASLYEWTDIYSISVAKFEQEEKAAEILAGDKRGAASTRPRYTKESGAARRKQQAPMLMMSLVNYIQTLEERISCLEQKKGNVGSENKGSVESEKKGNVRSENKGSVRNEALEYEAVDAPAQEPPETALKVRFIDVNDGVGAEGHFRHGKENDTFKEQYFMTVVYDWKDASNKAQTRLGKGGWPSATGIDIVAIFLRSEPIVLFLKLNIMLPFANDELLRITKPFRPILLGADALRGQLKILRAMYGCETNPEKDELEINSAAHSEVQPDNQLPRAGADVNGNGTDSPSDLEDSDQAEGSTEQLYNRPAALMHFELLVTFIDTYFTEQQRLFKSIANATEERIAFENLWMAFLPGSTIVCWSAEGGKVLKNFGLHHDEKHISRRRDVVQAYRVLAVDGGRPLQQVHVHQDDNEVANVRQLQIQSIHQGQFFMKLIADQASQKEGDRRVKDHYTPLVVYCYHLDTDGIIYNTVPEIFSLAPFEDIVEVRSLEIFPVQYLATSTTDSRLPRTKSKKAAHLGAETSGADVQLQGARDLLERGKRFMDLATVSHMTYKGLTVGDTKEEIDSSVIVDIRFGFQQHKEAFERMDIIPKFAPLNTFWYVHDYAVLPELSPACNISWCTRASCGFDIYTVYQRMLRDRSARQVSRQLEEYNVEQFKPSVRLETVKRLMEAAGFIQLLPGVVPGFVLNNRKWVTLDITRLQYVRQEDNWKDLVLPEGYRDIVQSMVEGYFRGHLNPAHEVQFGMDPVQGKGKGCIVLLHGPPGVGKTSTAECVASYKQRPLYSISCGDVGYEPQEVEENMEKHFKLAHKWGCVLLLDEADVFLAKRNREDVKRNGLVSGFLRILEYYSGILFLTTNRVGAIDDAFRSRLHLTLYYPRLDGSQTLRIWKSNIKRLKLINQERKDHGRQPIKYDKKKILAFAEEYWEQLDWNGRQIRNAFQTAIALAEFRNRSASSTGPPLLEVSQFVDLANASQDFNDYLHAVHGGDESKSAVKAKWRADTSYQRGHRSKKTFQIPKEEESEVDTSDDDSDEDDESTTKRVSTDKTKKRSKNAKGKHSKGKSKNIDKEAEDSDVSGDSSESEPTESAPSKEKRRAAKK